MSDLEKFNSEKLSTPEMKQVQGGNWADDLLKVVKKIEDILP